MSYVLDVSSPSWGRHGSVQSVLHVNGAFLLAAGFAALAADLAGYFFGAGPFWGLCKLRAAAEWVVGARRHAEMLQRPGIDQIQSVLPAFWDGTASLHGG